MREAVEPLLERRPAADWLERFREEGVPAGPIHDTTSVWADEHIERRGLRRTIPREDRPDAEVVDDPVHFSALSTTVTRPPQRLGESTDAVLREHGYDEREIERLRERGAVD